MLCRKNMTALVQKWGLKIARFCQTSKIEPNFNILLFSIPGAPGQACWWQALQVRRLSEAVQPQDWSAASHVSSHRWKALLLRRLWQGVHPGGQNDQAFGHTQEETAHPHELKARCCSYAVVMAAVLFWWLLCCFDGCYAVLMAAMLLCDDCSIGLSFWTMQQDKTILMN